MSINKMNEATENLHNEFKQLIVLKKSVELVLRRALLTRLRLQGMRLELFDQLVEYSEIIRTQDMPDARKADTYQKIINFVRAIDLA